MWGPLGTCTLVVRCVASVADLGPQAPGIHAHSHTRDFRTPRLTLTRVGAWGLPWKLPADSGAPAATSTAGSHTVSSSIATPPHSDCGGGVGLATPTVAAAAPAREGTSTAAGVMPAQPPPRPSPSAVSTPTLAAQLGGMTEGLCESSWATTPFARAAKGSGEGRGAFSDTHRNSPLPASLTSPHQPVTW